MNAVVVGISITAPMGARQLTIGLPIYLTPATRLRNIGAIAPCSIFLCPQLSFGLASGLMKSLLKTQNLAGHHSVTFRLVLMEVLPECDISIYFSYGHMWLPIIFKYNNDIILEGLKLVSKFMITFR